MALMQLRQEQGELGAYQAVITSTEVAHDPTPPNFLYEHVVRVISGPSVSIGSACFFMRWQFTAVSAHPEQK